MTRRSKRALAIVAALSGAVLISPPSYAIDYQPFDFVPAPAGTFMLMGYYEYGTRNLLNNTITGTYTKNTGLSSQIGIFRPLYYGSVFDHPYLVEFLLPFGKLYNGQINGVRLSDASGVGDPILSATFWPISRPESKTWFSISEWISVPIGSYDKHQALNLGSNRWQADTQLNITQGFLDKFTIDASVDWIAYGNNSNAGNGSQTLSQSGTFNFYTWLSYDTSDMMRKVMPSLGNSSISVGFAGTWFGKQRLDGTYTGSKTQENQIRITYEQFITPTWQALISFNHDISVSGQFKQDFGLVFRLTKVF